MTRLNLGCGQHPMEGWVNVDHFPGPGVDVAMNIENDHAYLRHFGVDSITEVMASHVIEHLVNPLAMMQGLYSVCAPDARATFACPYGSSDDADENPTHVRRMFVGSWGYFGQPMWWRDSTDYTADWVVEEIHLRVDSGMWAWACGIAQDDQQAVTVLWERIQQTRNVVKEQVATLRCNKPARPRDRALQENRTIVFEVLEPLNAWENAVREVGRLGMGTRGEDDG